MALVVALSGSDGGDGGEATATPTQKEETAPRQEKPKPETLTRSELIAQGDAICVQSQETFRAYRDEFPAGESEPSVGYSRLLVQISSKAVRRFDELVPPPQLQRQYAAYLRSQEAVRGWDRDALAAAEAGDEAAYLAARETRNRSAPERRQLAAAVGFEVCSQ